jgi:hypothetical protein
MKLYQHARFCASLVISSLLTTAQAGEFSGYAGGEIRQFFEGPLSPSQHDSYLSGITEPEYFQEWDEGAQYLEVKLFYIKDQYDDQRTHGDIRELSWTGVYDNWEVRAGISKVFWGVAETQHLVDIVNQTDLVVNVDGEDKLGQPMLRVSTEHDWGTLSFFILPGFRERTFPGTEGRPRTETVVDTERDAIYDSSSGKDHIDFAGRYSHYIGDWEFGLSLFSGTGRDPTNYSPLAFDTNGQPSVAVPVYSLINQIGFDGQAFFGDWTWKLEATNTEVRSGEKKGINSFRTVAGFEYTFVGVAESSMDIGVVFEYHYSDERIIDTIYDNDLATALRFVLNDIQSTEVLTGIFTDANTQSIGSFIEASRRLGDSWTLEAQVRAFHSTTENRPLYSYRFDDFAQIDLNYHF